MYLESLSLTNFRNYVRLDLELVPHVIVLKGANAQGKTNLLEAIYYLAMASSPLADADRQVINWLATEDTLPHARLVGRVAKGNGTTLIEITLMLPNNGTNGSLRKGIRVNGVNKRVAEFVGQLNVVLFLPQDISLVDGSPGKRRRYLNAMLCQTDPRYYRALQKYGQVVYQRNHLLKRLRDRRQDPEQLVFWDQQMTEDGAYLIERRQWLIRRLNEIIADIHPALTGGDEHLRLDYRPGVDLVASGDENGQLALRLHETSQQEIKVPDIQRAFAQALIAVRGREIARGISLVGPHRDDLRFVANSVDMNIYGSRGQQRTTALTVKLGEVEWLRQETGEMPVLLLDDVLSELDPDRSSYLVETLHRAQQVMMTTTDIHGVDAEFLENATLYEVEGGRLTPLTQANDLHS